MSDPKGKYPFESFNESSYLPKYRGEKAESGMMTSTRMYSSLSTPMVTNDGMDSAGIGWVFEVGDLWNYMLTDVWYKCNDNATNNALWEVLGGTQTIVEIDAPTYEMSLLNSFYSVNYTEIGAVTLTLPPLVESVGRTFTVSDSGANSAVKNITIVPNGDDKIIGNALDQECAIINSNGSVLRFLGLNASNWKIY
jgi:hypothetical protein